MINNFHSLNNKIIKCISCPRLVKFRKKIANEKRKQYINQNYWGKPINGFGDVNAEILFVGLAPAAHGGNRTGRVFTGDKSSEFLYKCLYKAKISNQPYSVDLNDGLKLSNAFITTALKCVPPGDKPTKK
jgi:Uracil-DNA glycosylase